ncbi:hypothetical protein [Microbacterium arborescens]|uniref:hypothetical protein n=1 Tax=Microbacterium arborescens TaxID=33883 RepID=UPI003C784DE3
MISAADLAHLDEVPHEAKPLALWLWLNLDPLGRGPMDTGRIAREMYPADAFPGLDWYAAQDTVLEHLVELMDAGFLTTYVAGGAEWLLLLHPLRVDMRGVRISTPEPPARDRPWTSVAVGRGSAGGRERARERARAQVRAEDAARADAWDAVTQDREEEPVLPERPLILDAPPMFCDDHMPHGAGKTKCGPCRDARLKRDEWLTRRVYEEKLTVHFERAGTPDEEPW